MRRIAVYTENRGIIERLELLFGGSCEIVPCSAGESPAGFDGVIIDREYTSLAYPQALVLPFFEEGGRIRTLPLPLREAVDYVSGCDARAPRVVLELKEDGRTAILGERRVKLTEVEYRLLSALLFAEGFVAREALLREVWGEGVDPGVLNVYVHYLREKLEVGGEKMILSSRKLGYAIDERFRGGRIC